MLTWSFPSVVRFARRRTRRPRFRRAQPPGVSRSMSGSVPVGVCGGCHQGFDLGRDVADVFEREGQGEGVGDGVDVVQAGGEEQLAGQELGDGAVDHVRIAQGVLLSGRLVVGHEVRDFLAGDGGIGLGRDVAVQQQAQAEQHDGLDPAQRALLAQDAGTGAAADGLRVHRAQDRNLALVVQLQGQEELRTGGCAGSAGCPAAWSTASRPGRRRHTGPSAASPAPGAPSSRARRCRRGTAPRRPQRCRGA